MAGEQPLTQDEKPDGHAPLRSVHTPNFPELLRQLGCSLFVTTYQAGKLIIVRENDGQLNTHFRTFKMPTGLAINATRLALGTDVRVWDFWNTPEVGAKLDPSGKIDACFLPRNVHYTGAIDVHEMAWADDDLWLVNTAFSCLCTLDVTNSFVPRWTPPFVTQLLPEDRCHLNGLGLVQGQPRFVTLLAATDTPQGWRPHKATGGMVLDVPSGATVAAGLCMPHSPRWHREQLWVLESGAGRLDVVDLATGKAIPVAEFDGFPRGLDFFGPLAFVGLSQVRETAVFGGLPITQRDLKDRMCGIVVLDIRSGQTVATLRFEDAVQEIFAVQVLPDVRFPELLDGEEISIAAYFQLPS